MPPIFGILNASLQPPPPEVTRRMHGAAKYVKARRVEAREVKGGYLATAVVNDRSFSAGEVFAESGEWCIVADVCLYGREELERKMGRRGEGDRGRGGEGDTALILEAYLKWGMKCLQHLYGDFAFVIFNIQTGEVCCGRDPMGVRPLFYAIADGQFMFASELRYVVAALPHQPPIRHEYLLDTLVTVKTHKDLTAFEGIYRLKPGHFLRVSGGEATTHAYWAMDPVKTIRFDREDDYVRLFREKLVQAVNRRCEGIKNLGSELSGGLDSSAVCGIAARFARQENYAFTALSNVFPNGTTVEFRDEREFIEAMLEFEILIWRGIDRLKLTIPELLAHTLRIQGCFIQQNFNVFNQGIYEAAGEKEMEVLLSGFGGDELVSARTSMPWNELIREKQWQVIRSELYGKGVTLKSILKPLLLAARYLKSRIYRPAFTTGVFTRELLDNRFANLPLQPEFSDRNSLSQHMKEKYKFPRRDLLAQKQLARIMLDHLPQRMEYCYTAAAQYGCEYRYPLLDTDLMETCLAFPPWVKQHHGINRYIFRQAIAGFVPEKIRQRDDKSGTTIPQTYYSLVTEREAILGLVNSCSGSAFLNGIFDLARFPDWYDRLVKRDKNDMNYLMPGAFYDYLMMMLFYRDM